MQWILHDPKKIYLILSVSDSVVFPHPSWFVGIYILLSCQYLINGKFRDNPLEKGSLVGITGMLTK